MADSIFRNRRRGRAFWLFLPLLLFLYLLLFPHPGGRESLMRPVWARELSAAAPGSAAPRTAATVSADAPSWYFRAADNFGYADLQGNLYYVGRRLHNLSLSDIGFINYGSVPDHVVFMNPRGEFQFSIRSYGYPLLEPGGQVLYSINTDRSGVKRIDSEGEILWSMSFPTPVTTIALAAEQCLLGLMDGRALLVDAEGDVVYQHSPDGSRIPVLLGTAVSQDLNRIALISGIDPQRLTVFQRRAEEFVPDYTQDLDSDFRREVRLSFSPDARFLFYEIEEGLGVLDVRKKKRGGFLTEGVLESMDSSPEFSAAAFRLEAGGAKLLVFRPLSSVLLSREIAADRVYVKVLGNSLILGLRGVLLRADLLEG
jgi:hypothetical protein